MDYEIIPILEDIAKALEKIEKHLERLTKEKKRTPDIIEPDEDKD